MIILFETLLGCKEFSRYPKQPYSRPRVQGTRVWVDIFLDIVNIWPIINPSNLKMYVLLLKNCAEHTYAQTFRQSTKFRKEADACTQSNLYYRTAITQPFDHLPPHSPFTISPIVIKDKIFKDIHYSVATVSQSYVKAFKNICVCMNM